MKIPGPNTAKEINTFFKEIGRTKVKRKVERMRWKGGERVVFSEYKMYISYS